jgi:dUTP pyrophosphatase
MKKRLPEVLIHILPGGAMPKRQSNGAIGFDVTVRAIVSPHEMDSRNPNLRKTLFDFENIPADPEIARHAKWQKRDGGGRELVYEMDPHESVLVGIGFITAMPFPIFYWVAPRSGLASRWGITVTNAPGTVDPDYRGEAGVLVYNRNDKPFALKRSMRIAQIIFQSAIMPDFKKRKKLPKTIRNAGGFGSTGLF